jgi:hypothetical protein
MISLSLSTIAWIRLNIVHVGAISFSPNSKITAKDQNKGPYPINEFLSHPYQELFGYFICIFATLPWSVQCSYNYPKT